MSFVIWVEFDVATENRDRFLELVKSNATESVSMEPGCRRFDVLEPEDGDGLIALYEIYDSKAAFDEHLSSLHFREFDALSSPLVRRKVVRSYAVHQNSK